ncbi:MAG: class F sortase [bacterium]|nr:class F sortase [bacterium]
MYKKILSSAIILIIIFSFVFSGHHKALMAPVLPEAGSVIREEKKAAISPIAKAEPVKTPASVVTRQAPNRLVIPRIGVDAPVRAMGLTRDGKMAVPSNYREIGWYKPGTLPGEKGSAVMGAHVDSGEYSPRIAGVFKHLHLLAVGDSLYVIDNAGQKIRFEVTEVSFYRYNDPASEVFNRNDTARLNLITCFGKWLEDKNTYDQRVIVFAEARS